MGDRFERHLTTIQRMRIENDDRAEIRRAELAKDRRECLAWWLRVDESELHPVDVLEERYGIRDDT